MARQEKILSARGVAAISKPGRHSDGGGLYLYAKNGSRSWIYMFSWHGKQSEMGLGPYPTVTLAMARERRDKWRRVLLDGQNPIEVRKFGRVAPTTKTFGQCADELLASKESGWRNEKHRAQWAMTLHDYCVAIWGMPVDLVDVEAVLGVLKPHWARVPETASRLRARIEATLSYAISRNYRAGPNPAVWRDHLSNLLAKRPPLSRKHFPAMDYRDLPEFIGRLREYQAMSVAASALEFCILTAVRSGEALGATWSEINLETAVWSIPGHRTKSGRPHDVPLPPRAVAILGSMIAIRTDGHVFPGQQRGKPLSPSALPAVLARLKVEGAVPHGFRSSFRDWAGNETSFPRELAEHALSHVCGDSTERAYRRGNALERRRELMITWANHCEPCADQNIVQLQAARK
jgi:integrase